MTRNPAATMALISASTEPNPSAPMAATSTAAQSAQKQAASDATSIERHAMIARSMGNPARCRTAGSLLMS
jgi:hypothetical protein